MSYEEYNDLFIKAQQNDNAKYIAFVFDIKSSKLMDKRTRKSAQLKTFNTINLMIKYIKTFGFRVNNDAFQKNSWYFRNALVRANYNNLQKGIHSTTKFLEMFFGNLLLETNHELKNRYMHVDYVAENDFQSAKPEIQKCQFGTFDCTLEELALLELIAKNSSITQQELADILGKSLRTVKRLMKSLQDKNYIRRESGKRYGKWEVLV